MNENGVTSIMEQVKGIWKRHYKHLVHEESSEKAVLSSIGMEAGGKWVTVPIGYWNGDERSSS